MIVMAKIDESRPFIAINIAVMTVSDTRTLDTDKSGDILVNRITDAGHTVTERIIVADDKQALQAQVSTWISDPKIDVVITTGGTGFTGRDVTPEALQPLFEKHIDGFSTVFHMISYEKIQT
ncbi:MAG: molybdenum cofactor biosynthesis protein B, partial [Hyphomicrobiaceae bacterium]